MNAEYHIGPAGWSYPDWDGIVYPRPKPRGFDPLAYLASYFNLIEVNSTFYRIPTRRICRSWSERVAFRPDFRFTVKAFQDLTHGRLPAKHRAGGSLDGQATRLIDEFKSAVDPLTASGRLSAVLVQFPWSFRFSDDAAHYVASLEGAFAPIPAAVEVRHGSWHAPEAVRCFADGNITMCGIDQPLIGKSLGPDTFVNGRAGAYFRLHGRNYSAWFDRKAGRDQRYNYMYKPSEVVEWSDRIRSGGEGAERIHVVLNNHFEGQAAANALEISAALTGTKPTSPEGLTNRHPRLRVTATVRSGGTWSSLPTDTAESGGTPSGLPSEGEPSRQRSLFDEQE